MYLLPKIVKWEKFEGKRFSGAERFGPLLTRSPLSIFCRNVPQDIRYERDYELAWHEQEARRNKLLRIR